MCKKQLQQLSNLLFKNNNLIGKKSNYKSSPQIELESLFEYNSSLPLINKQNNFNNFFAPLGVIIYEYKPYTDLFFFNFLI